MSGKVREKKKKNYFIFMDFKQAYDMVNTEALWQMLVIFNAGVGLRNGIKSMYVRSEVIVKINWMEKEKENNDFV